MSTSAVSLRKLYRSTNQQLLLSELQEESSFWGRARGLLGRKVPLSKNQGLWLIPGASIHTCFMNFPIDVIFLSKSMKVVSTFSEVKPWRLIGFQWGAYSVIETSAGQIQQWNITKGEVLHVGT